MMFFKRFSRKLAYLSLTKLTAFIVVCSLLTACANASNTPQIGAQSGIQESPSLEQVNNASQNENSDLPEAVSNAILKDASKRTGQSNDKLKIIASESRTWKDGCLGLADPGSLCTQVVVPGWEVKVSNTKSQTWVYRTNNSGSLVKLDPASKS
ncbi:hypothetical protein DSM106972_036620 [Dulcicalothrix desertica PCC 7102]|uniref:Lipoprotein n=1 Tax=Dulcicalothrix desertica PCC 7102 TaxID=232991 RepID=A0A433VHW0_9CYAN|nr:hypothetical protein [Dulcicalothrix desertica]RUT05655.1 hypothetical protein DSM106972_036620 [Dulcicalothrix desertica PCC 7102]TWH39678.1 hypothetical protein CAL7102_08929 [Dulcicalothrix desertica PCC 7102]